MNEQITATGTDHPISRPAHPRFAVPLSATRRGARLARLLANERFQAWGVPFESAQLVVAELASNAALHACEPAHTLRLALTLGDAGTLRIEVTDGDQGRRPVVQRGPQSDRESGYGLLIVERLADRWGVEAGPGPGKTVWAELDLGHRTGSRGSWPRLDGAWGHGTSKTKNFG